MGKADIRFGHGLATSLCLAFLLIAPQLADAELQRVEAMGNYGIRESTRTRVIARDEAIAKARWEGVSRVALELIGEAAPSEPESSSDSGESAEPGIETAPPIRHRPGQPILPPIDSRDPGQGARAPSFPPVDKEPLVEDPDRPSEDQIAELRKALGKDVLPYMRSYRILDDQGEVPVFIRDDPEVVMEYVVVVEVLVDVDRVTSALEEAGLIARSAAVPSEEAISVELLGLSRFEAVEVLLVALREQFGATRVRTVEFSRERQVLLVEGPFEPRTLSAKLARFENSRLILEPIGIDSRGRRIRLMGRWFPEPEQPDEEDQGSDS